MYIKTTVFWETKKTPVIKKVIDNKTRAILISANNFFTVLTASSKFKFTNVILAKNFLRRI